MSEREKRSAAEAILRLQDELDAAEARAEGAEQNAEYHQQVSAKTEQYRAAAVADLARLRSLLESDEGLRMNAGCNLCPPCASRARRILDALSAATGGDEDG